MNTKNNQRFLHTEEQLEHAFLSLCRTSDPQQITVSQLCKIVGINRSTFYSHYLDMPDLIQKTGIKYMAELARLITQTENKTDFPFSQHSLLQLLSYIAQNQDFYDIYFHHARPQSIERSLSAFLEAACSPYLEHVQIASKEAAAYHITFFKAGFIAILSRWVAYGCKEKPEELTAILLQTPPILNRL